jgi:hypothetical protein
MRGNGIRDLRSRPDGPGGRREALPARDGRGSAYGAILWLASDVVAGSGRVTRDSLSGEHKRSTAAVTTKTAPLATTIAPTLSSENTVA